MRAVRAMAIILTGIALIPGGAHVFELPNKLSLPQAEYFVVQQIYRGWAMFGTAIVAAFAANAALAAVRWRRGAAFQLPLLACLAIAASLAVFFTWVYPGNIATDNWTVAPPNWQTLRPLWEYGHAAAAALIFAAFCAVASSRSCGSDHAIGPQRGDC